MKKILLGLFFGMIVWSAFGEDARTAYTKELQKAWTQDGLTIKTGFDRDGTQNLAVLAKGGYFPLSLQAKAGVRSVLRVYTDRTFDCSRAFFLPDLRARAILSPTGVQEFPLPPQNKGAVLRGTCGMGMYYFEITFQ